MSFDGSWLGDPDCRLGNDCGGFVIDYGGLRNISHGMINDSGRFVSDRRGLSYEGSWFVSDDGGLRSVNGGPIKES